MSRFIISIRSTNAHDEISCDLFEPFYANTYDNKSQIYAAQVSKANKISPVILSQIWNIHPDLAVKTLNQTTQLNHQGDYNDLFRHCSTNDRMLCYKRINSQFVTNTFFVNAKDKSTRGNTCWQIFLIEKGFVAVYPMENKIRFENALQQFCKDFGVQYTLVVEPSGEKTKKKVCCLYHQVVTTLKIISKSTQSTNHAELYASLLKRNYS